MTDSANEGASGEGRASAGGDAPEDGRCGGDTDEPGAKASVAAASSTAVDEPHTDAPVDFVLPEWGGSIGSLAEPDSGEVAVHVGAEGLHIGGGGAPVRSLHE